MSLPVIVRARAEQDIELAFAELECVRPGLGRQFTRRVRDLFDRIEAMPEMYGVVWQDVRACSTKAIPPCGLLPGIR